jgi:hypothetical protein
MECGAFPASQQTELCWECQERIEQDQEAIDRAYDAEQARVDHITGGLSAAMYNKREEECPR